jgi:hypothetical protein
MKRNAGIFSVVSILALVACAPGMNGGPMAKRNGPTGGFADRQGNGFTAGVQGEAKLVGFSIIGEAGWTRFDGKEVNGVETDAVNFWETAIGGRLYMGPAYLGGTLGQRAGSDIRGQATLRPEAGVRIGPLNAFGQYQLLGDRWWSLGASFSLF